MLVCSSEARALYRTSLEGAANLACSAIQGSTVEAGSRVQGRTA